MKSEDWIRNYVKKHPDASLDTIARVAKDARHGIQKERITTLRREVRRKLGYYNVESVIPSIEVHPGEGLLPSTVLVNREAEVKELTKIAIANRRADDQLKSIPTPAEEKNPLKFNSGKEFLTYLGLDPALAKEEEPMPVTPVPAPPKFKTKEEFLNYLLEKEPGLDPQLAQGTIRKEFGSGLPNSYLYDTLRIARELNNLPQIPRKSHKPKEPKPVPPAAAAAVAAPAPTAQTRDVAEVVKGIAADMDAQGWSKITISISDSGDVTWQTELVPRKTSGTLKR